jgi:hypothetical protein
VASLGQVKAVNYDRVVVFIVANSPGDSLE